MGKQHEFSFETRKISGSEGDEVTLDSEDDFVEATNIAVSDDGQLVPQQVIGEPVELEVMASLDDPANDSITVNIHQTTDDEQTAEQEISIEDGLQTYSLSGFYFEPSVVSVDVVFESSIAGSEPKVEEFGVVIEEHDGGTETLAWTGDGEWAGGAEVIGLVAEDTPNTDHDDGQTIKRGYSVANASPDDPYLYLPMHEETGDVAHNFGTAVDVGDGSIEGDVTTGVDGILGTTAYEFNSGVVEIGAYTPSPADKLACSSTNETVYLFNTEDWDDFTEMTSVGGDSNPVAWSPSADYFATGSGDNTVLVYDTENWDDPIELTDMGNSVLSLAWSPDGDSLAVGSEDNTAYVYDIEGWSGPTELTDAGGSVNSVEWSPGGSSLATASADGLGYVYSVGDWSDPIELTEAAGGLNSAAWSPDGEHFGIGSDDDLVYLYDPEDWEDPIELTDASGDILSLGWSPNSESLAVASQDESLYIYSVPDLDDPVELSDAAGSLNSVEWSPDGERLAAGSSDESAYVYESEDWEGPTELTEVGGGVSSVSWSPI